MIKLLVLDLDGTVWDHLDASSLKPPYRRISNDIVVDSNSVRVSLRRGARWFLEKIHSIVPLAVCSWNQWDKAYELLRAFGLDKYFGYLGIEPHPNKHLVFKKIIQWYQRIFKEEIEAEEILYVDDRRVHLDDIYKYIGRVKFMQMGVDVKDFYELYDVLKRELSLE